MTISTSPMRTITVFGWNKLDFFDGTEDNHIYCNHPDHVRKTFKKRLDKRKKEGYVVAPIKEKVLLHSAYCPCYKRFRRELVQGIAPEKIPFACLGEWSVDGYGTVQEDEDQKPLGGPWVPKSHSKEFLVGANGLTPNWINVDSLRPLIRRLKG